MRKSGGKGRLTLTAFLMLCLLSVSMTDLYIHTAHAGHDHDAHDMAAADMFYADMDGTAVDDDPADAQQPPANKAFDKFAHGCFVFTVPADGAGLLPTVREQKRVSTERFLTSLSRNRLERPPRTVS